MAQIVVFDLDGVIFKSPSRESIPDEHYWETYWSNPDSHKINKEIQTLMASLISSNIHILILTARPDSYEQVTYEAIYVKLGIQILTVKDILHFKFGHTSQYHLMMRPKLAVFDDWDSNALWKKSVLNWLVGAHDVLFAVEDYKPNAEEMRKVIPVLLYEQLRSVSGD